VSCSICGRSDIEHFCSVHDRLLGNTAQVWRILRCRHCGFGWTFPPLAENGISGYYPSAYLGEVRRTLEEFLSGRLARTRSWRGEVAKVRLLEGIVQSGRILDVGCGDGKFLWALDPGRWRRTGIELSRPTVDLVRGAIPDLELIAGDIFSETLPTSAFDAVTFWHVLEHLHDTRRVLFRARSLLRPGGWMIISLPNLDSLQARLFRSHWYAFDDVPRHLYHFSRISLNLILLEAGLTVHRHLLFSPDVNFHSWKHSLLNWSRATRAGRAPYCLFKPALFLFPLLERLTGRYGIMTVVARKPAG